MRRLSLVLLDLVLIALSTVVALLLRDNFEVSEAHFEALIPYLLCTLFAGSGDAAHARVQSVDLAL